MLAELHFFPFSTRERCTCDKNWQKFKHMLHFTFYQAKRILNIADSWFFSISQIRDHLLGDRVSYLLLSPFRHNISWIEYLKIDIFQRKCQKLLTYFLLTLMGNVWRRHCQCLCVCCFIRCVSLNGLWRRFFDDHCLFNTGPSTGRSPGVMRLCRRWRSMRSSPVATYNVNSEDTISPPPCRISVK